GCQKVAGGRSPRRPPEKVISHDRTPKGCQTSGQRKFTAKDLAPLRGATQLISRIPGGLRGLRPPATFFATLRVAEVSQLYSYRIRFIAGLFSIVRSRGLKTDFCGKSVAKANPEAPVKSHSLLETTLARLLVLLIGLSCATMSF